MDKNWVFLYKVSRETFSSPPKSECFLFSDFKDRVIGTHFLFAQTPEGHVPNVMLTSQQLQLSQWLVHFLPPTSPASDFLSLFIIH